MFKQKDAKIYIKTTNELKREAIKHAKANGYSSLTDLIEKLLWREVNKKGEQ